MTVAAAAMMQIRSRKEETRERILGAAVRLFQERGVADVGVDEIMRESGLTHGGFYAHFENKEALVAEACIRAVDTKMDELKELVSALDDDRAFKKYTNTFLNGDPRLDSPACPMAMLGPEVARREPVQRAYAARIRRLIAHIAKELECTREEAILTLSALVGATVLSAQTSSDGAFARKIITAVRDELLRCRETKTS